MNTQTMKVQLAFLICLTLFQSAVSQNCTEGVSCSSCTSLDGCGWCTATQQCLSGTINGPAGSYCIGYWDYDSCPDCTAYTDCETCKLHDTDCFWCSESGKTGCKNIGFVGCSYQDHCPCNIYGDCSQCIADSECKWCTATGGVCQEANDICSTSAFNQTTSCPCGSNGNCQLCSATNGCEWCDATQTCNEIGSDPTCSTPMNCQAYCSSATTCDDCILGLQGCMWCEDSNRCVDPATDDGPCFGTHTCPLCSKQTYCEPCIDEGCMWCETSKACQPIGSACNSSSLNCEDVCAALSNCQSCLAQQGCGWCEYEAGGFECKDLNEITVPCLTWSDTCTLPETGGEEDCDFDGGAFVGGMFLIVGSIVVGAVTYYVWMKYYKGKNPFKVSHPAAYNEL